MNFTLKHGRVFRRRRQYLESDGVTGIDCTGGILAAEVRPEPGGTLLATFTFEWVDITIGLFDQVLAVAAVDAIPDGVFRHDLVFTDALGEPHNLEEGTITKTGSITEP
ncbi:hypothetical protein [Luteolibacter marinus]|uniref:hypothetical protein n=1 Tax=Luteolibacter marinus TaxID=2776705 RepID=UPI0018681682|nr:hypothetical protein [Luteolibacter marinus]